MKKIAKGAKKQLFNILFLLLLVGITLTVLLLSYQELNFRNIFNFIKNSRWWLLIVAFFCMVAAIVFEGLAVWLISRRLGHKSKVLPSVAYSAADIYYSAITPSASGGQPASAYYMVKDGMSAGTASFTLVFNTIAYATSLVVLTIAVFAIRPALFLALEFWPKFFIILGAAIQTTLAVFLLLCMRFDKAVLKVCNGLVSLLAKIRIIKNTEKWRKKFADEVGKYADCYKIIRKDPLLFFEALALNICQRVVRVLITCCICKAADPQCSFRDVFVLQSYVTVGYTSLPMPGGVGAFEYLYLRAFGLIFADTAFILSSMMIMRTISYYLSIIVSGAITLSFHVLVMRRKPVEIPADTEEKIGQVQEERLPEEEKKDSGETENTSREEQSNNEEYV